MPLPLRNGPENSMAGMTSFEDAIARSSGRSWTSAPMTAPATR